MALERVDGPSGPERWDYLAAMVAAMVVKYQGRIDKDPPFDQLVWTFLKELPWTEKSDTRKT